MSTWGVPINMLMIDAGVRFAIEYAEGRIDPNDIEAFKDVSSMKLLRPAMLVKSRSSALMMKRLNLITS
jgi:hypothetical protein